MKITVGATWRARANRRAICCSLSPYHLDRRSDDLVAMKFASASRARLGEQGLAGARGARRAGSPWPGGCRAGGNASGILQRQLDAFAQPLARLVDAADIVPADIRRLDHHLAHGRGLDALQRSSKSLPLTDRVSSTSGGIVPSSRLIRGMIRRTASIAASRRERARSAPTKP
jgi:hypothetical protein